VESFSLHSCTLVLLRLVESKEMSVCCGVWVGLMIGTLWRAIKYHVCRRYGTYVLRWYTYVEANLESRSSQSVHSPN
jgi:hypothetical protein